MFIGVLLGKASTSLGGSIFQLRQSVAPFKKNMCTIKDLKIALRNEISSSLSELSPEEKKKQSEAVAKKVLASKEYLMSQRVSIFLSTASEINTKPIIEKIFRDKKQCFIPSFPRETFGLTWTTSRISKVYSEHITIFNSVTIARRYSKQKMEMVKLYSMEDWENLPLTSWKIKQPKLKEDRENAMNTGGMDLLIVPGVGFTKDGKRLGHGGGYYDRYIQNLKANQKYPIMTVGLAFREQILNDIPIDDNDQIIDRIIFAD